jgi:hypothetical protein
MGRDKRKETTGDAMTPRRETAGCKAIDLNMDTILPNSDRDNANDWSP